MHHSKLGFIKRDQGYERLKQPEKRCSSLDNLRYAWEPFLSYGQKKEYNKNAMIYRQGETGHGFFYLDSGAVKITIDSDQYEERMIDLVPTGALFGVHGVYPNEQYLTTAITTVPSVLYYFSSRSLSQIYALHPEAATIFVQFVIDKIRLLAESIYYLDNPIEQQMAYYLLRLHRTHEIETIPIDQSTFAQYIGKSRGSVNKVIQKWKQEGLIQCTNQGIHLLNADKMKGIITV